ncbi:MAG: class I SAM-dependent methyltransferase [Anaerolineae bacterium]|nr:class I SAM-dependent methyltransferase [Anaerolineae bacterium]
MYDLTDYGNMMADQVRMDPYAYALKTAVTPQSVVLDIGTAIGIHALLACKFGARKVYAVEPNDAIDLAWQVAEANGYADRIEFIQDSSTNISLPERADVIVSDLRGVLPLFGEHIPAIVDARHRHLAPNGMLIPQKDTLWVSVVEAPLVYKNMLKSWADPYGFTMEPARQIILNQWQHDDTDLIRVSHLLTEPTNWATLDYRTITDPDVSASIEQTAVRDGTAHGLLVWFDAELLNGIGFSNAPQSVKSAAVYGRGFFPFLKPVHLTAGDTIRLAIQAAHTEDGYTWQWQTQILSHNNPKIILADFKQGS